MTISAGGPPLDAREEAEQSRSIRVSASGLRVRLGGRDVLDGLDITVKAGELVAVSGPSGVGKTTLLLVLAGVLTPDAGVVEVAGRGRSPAAGGAGVGDGARRGYSDGEALHGSDERAEHGDDAPAGSPSGMGVGRAGGGPAPVAEAGPGGSGLGLGRGEALGATGRSDRPGDDAAGADPSVFDPLGSPDIPVPASTGGVPGGPGGRRTEPGSGRAGSRPRGAGSAIGLRRRSRHKSRQEAAPGGPLPGIAADGDRQDRRSAHERDSLPLGVGFVPQTFGLAPWLTTAENVALVMQVLGLPPDVVEERTMEALGAVGLAAAFDRIVTELSGGQRQRVAVARALAAKPAVIIADEPTAELDAENRSLVLELLLDAADAGAAVVLATHDQEVTRRCTRLLVLSRGRLSEAR